jgi:DNA-binding transcriptional MerR regulator
MEKLNDTPLYNMSVVLRETGLKADTLRTWERRFGVPNPARTAGGHRQYSKKDIATVQWLIARQQEGMRISKAVQLLNHLQDLGQDPVAEMISPSQIVQPVMNLGQVSQLDDLRNAWVEACLQFDEISAEQILTQTFALFPVEMACPEILQKGAAEIGAMWCNGSISVQREHFASALALRRVHSLIAATAPPTRNEDIIVACPPHEDHTFAPLLLVLMLRRRGLPVYYLGANVPVEQLLDTIIKIRPALTVFSAQQLATAATLRDVARTLGEHDKPVAYGGRIFNLRPRVQDRMPGHFLGADLAIAIETIEDLLHHSRPMPAGVPRSREYDETLRVFAQKRAAITAEVFAQIPDGLMPPAVVQIACESLSSNVAAALKLGDMTLLGEEITWGSGIIQNHTLNGSYLKSFLQLYGEAVERQLRNKGRIVSEWFNQR